MNRKQTSPDNLPEIEDGWLFSVSRDISTFDAHLVALWRKEDVFKSIRSICIFAVKVLSCYFTLFDLSECVDLLEAVEGIEEEVWASHFP